MTVLDDEVLSTEGTAYTDFAEGTYMGYSTMGFVLNLAGGPVGWTSSKQTVVATSSLKAEFVALSKGCNINYFHHLLDMINQTRERPQCGRETRAL